MVKKAAFYLFVAVFIFSFSAVVLAAERSEWKDQDKDGRKETQFFYEGSKITRSQVDKNGDGKPDQWIYFKNGIRHTAEVDSDFDGKIDKWIIYDAEGSQKQVAKDTNRDGKPDQFVTYLQGRDLILKEYDRNFDGRIDMRTLKQWDQNRKITTFINGRPGWLPNPSYLTLRKEEDSNFDGKIDVYRERGNKNPPSDKIGTEIDPLPAKNEEKKAASESAGKKNETDTKAENQTVKLVQDMNERHGLN